MSSLGQTQGSRWIPLMEYAMKNGVSLSTLRRHIKSKKLTHRIEDGRYLLLDDEMPVLSATMAPAKNASGAEFQPLVHKLQAELQRAHEEIAELKTLIALYEERIPQPKLDV